MSIPRLGARGRAVVVLAASLLATARPASAQPPTPTLLSVTADAGMVTLTWTRAWDLRTRYRAEAGSRPGSSDLATGILLFGETGWAVGNVPAGTYYVRIRAELLGDVSAPSNELVVTVPGCPPPVPPHLQAEAHGQTVIIQWTFGQNPVGCWPTALSLEAGSAPGASDVLSLPVPDFNVTQRTFSSVPFGTYFVRARVVHPGFAPVATNEVQLNIGCLPPPSILNPTVQTVGNAARFSWWYASAPGADFTVFLEAGSQPGAADIATIAIPWDAADGFNVAGAAGSFFTRLRAVNACGATVSEEVPVTLTAECVAPEPIPFIDAWMFIGANRLTVNWDSPTSGGLVLAYQVRVGSSPGEADIGQRTVDGRYATFPTFYESFPTTASRAHVRVMPVNACGAAPRAADAHASVVPCNNPPAPRYMSAQVTGNSVTLWWSGTGELESPYPTYAEIGRSPGGSDVLVSPDTYSYGVPTVTTTLSPGRYYARARRRGASGCNEVSNASREVTFVVP